MYFPPITPNIYIYQYILDIIIIIIIIIKKD